MKKSLLIMQILVAIMITSFLPTRAQIQNGFADNNLRPDLMMNFHIDGSVDPLIADSCYNIYIADLGSEITDEDFLCQVPVVNKKFGFSTRIDTIKKGRIRAVFPGNKLCSAWIDLFFIPGFTEFLTVHNGYYDLHNNGEYQFMVKAWENKNSLSALFSNIATGPEDTNSKRLEEVQSAISLYRELLKHYEQELQRCTSKPFTWLPQKDITSYIKSIMKKIDETNRKMEKVIEDYVSTIQK